MDSPDPQMLAYMLQSRPPSIEERIAQSVGNVTLGLGRQGMLPRMDYAGMPMSSNVDDRRFKGLPSYHPQHPQYAKPVPVQPDSTPPYVPDAENWDMAQSAGYGDIGKVMPSASAELRRYLQGMGSR